MEGEGQGMWATLALLASSPGRHSVGEDEERVAEWLEALLRRIAVATQAPPPDPTPALRRKVLVSSFSHPHIRSRLERLMGTSVVRMTDRNYMQKLQERILEDHLEKQRLRIKKREADEVEREKKLILQGKVPVSSAPKELVDHPVFRITQLTQEIIEERRVQAIKKPRSPRSYRKQLAKREVPPRVEPDWKSDEEEQEKEREQSQSTVEESDEGTKDMTVEEEEVPAKTEAEEPPQISEEEMKYMFTQEDYDRLKYESPLIKQLRLVETVEEMYELADEIVGPLKKSK